LATLTAINSALQSENGELRQQLDAAATPTTATGAVLLPCISAAGRGIGSSAASAHNQLALLSAAGASHADQRSCLTTAACLPATLPSTLPACPPAEADVAELQEEFARRLGQADRAIAALQVGTCLCPVTIRMCS
jgi:hypothetical protein